MKRYQIVECAMRNYAGRIDTAIIWDSQVSKEDLAKFETIVGTSDYHGWQDNPAIAAIFNIDSNESENEDAEYIEWMEKHEGEYEYAPDDDEISA